MRAPRIRSRAGRSSAVSSVPSKRTLPETRAGLTVRYPEAGVTALDGLDLDLARGETLALVGESGSALPETRAGDGSRPRIASAT
jgi:ABC-type transport system involved in cytochrome bd biosynthesis fused ATPase/permease subunit